MRRIMQQILVVRKYDDFSRILAVGGYEVINLPLIETKPLDDLSELDAKLAAIENYDGVFLTSANATEIFRAKLIEKNVNFSGKIYVLGKRSYELLKSENLNLFFDETANTAREMLEKIPAKNLKGKRFLFVRGEKSLRVVPNSLSKTATVEEAVVYKTENIRVEAGRSNDLRERSAAGEIVAACFFSPSAAQSFVEQFGADILHLTIIATIGKTTAKFFGKLSLRVDLVSTKATAEDFAAELVRVLRNRAKIRR